MSRENLAEKLKDAATPLRLVFVCATGITGFDAPSVSTVYLDRSMKNHTLMPTIARTNRVFPEKDSGLIFDYVGIFRNLEKALAIYGAASAGESPIEIIDALAGELDAAVADLISFCANVGVDLPAVRDAEGFDHIAKRDPAVEALLVDEDTQNDFTVKARQVRKLFKALLPHPKATASSATWPRFGCSTRASSKSADRLRPTSRRWPTPSTPCSKGQSVRRKCVIRTAAEGSNPAPLVDLSLVEFDGLAAKFAGRKQAETDRFAQSLRQQAIGAALHNPIRYELVERIEQLIDDYNAGSVNIDEYLRRPIGLSKTLTEEEERAVREDMAEEELAIFDLLTQPDPVLTDEKRETVKASARQSLGHVHEKLVQDWRRRIATTSDANSTVRRVLDQSLPETPYTVDIFHTKVQLVFEHVLTPYGDSGESAYDPRPDYQFPQGVRSSTRGLSMWTGSPTTSSHVSPPTLSSRQGWPLNLGRAIRCE